MNRGERDDVRTVLMRALARFTVAGSWCKGEFEQPDGKMCLMGAVNVACHGSALPSLEHFETNGTCALAEVYLDNFVARRPRSRVKLAIEFNDTRGWKGQTTQLLEEAIQWL